MRKEIKNNIKKITALIMSFALVLPTQYVVMADTENDGSSDQVVTHTDHTEEHTLNYEDNNDGTHTISCTVSGCDYIQNTEDHSYVDDICEKCDATQNNNTESHNLTYVDNNDGTHTISCSEDECDYSQVTESHAYTGDECICGAKNEVEASSSSSLSSSSGSMEQVEVSLFSAAPIALASASSELSEADEQERYNDTAGYVTPKLFKYLYEAYPSLRQNQAETTLTQADLRNNNSVTEIVIKPTDATREYAKNMVNFNALGDLKTVNTLVIDGVDEIRTMYLPPSIKHLTIKNTTLNLFRDTGLNGGYDGGEWCKILSNCDLETLVLENVTIGDRFASDSTTYATNNTFNISNCQDLSTFKVDVKFESSQSILTFNAGSTYNFNELTTANCSIKNNSSIGHVVLTCSNTNSFFYTNHYVTADDVSFNDLYFKDFIKTIADGNGDGCITQAEINAVTSLDINLNTVGSTKMDVIHDFSDLAKFKNLETLTIDLDNRNLAYIDNIIFPGINPDTKEANGTGNLKKVSITNTPFKLESLKLPSVEELVYTDNEYAPSGGGADYNPAITISDTQGKVAKLTIADSDISSLVMNNGADKQKKIELYVTNCPNLVNIEFTGTGYALLGDATISDCKSLKGIGQIVEGEGVSAKWQIDGYFIESIENNSATFNLSDCTALGDDVASITLKYNFTASQNLNVMAYGLTKINTKLNINSPQEAGKIYIYCDSSSAIAGQYKNELKFEVIQDSAAPSILVFPFGNHIRKAAKEGVGSGEPAYKRWVDSYDIVLRKGAASDQINNFTNTGDLTFYSEQAGSVRKAVEGIDGVQYEIPSVVEINDQGTLIPIAYGRGTIKAYTGSGDDKKYVGEVSVFVRNIVTGVTLVDSASPDSEAGATDTNPIYVSKNAKLSFSATTTYNDENMPGEHDEIYWMIAKDTNTAYQYDKLLVNHDGNDVMSSLEATSAGISVVSNAWDDSYTNTREFSFSNNGKFRILAQATVNKKDNASNGDVIRAGRYVEVVGPASINVANRNIVHGAEVPSVSTISITNLKNASISIKNAERYGNYFEITKTVDDTSGSIITENSQTWTLKLKNITGNTENAALQEIIKNNNTITLLINTDGAVSEETFNLSSVWEPIIDDTPEDNPDTPEDNPDTPGDNQNTPGENQNTPGDNQNTPGDNQNTPGDNQNTPGDSQNTPGDNQNTPSDNQDTPSDNQDTPSDNQDTPSDNQDTPSDNQNVPVDKPSEIKYDANQNVYKNTVPEEYSKLVEQLLGINQNTNQGNNEESSNYSSSNEGESSNSSSSNSQATSTNEATAVASTAVPSYTAPGKATVTELAVVNVDGTITKVAIHADASVSEAKSLPAAAVLSLNDPATINTAAPTVVNSVNVVVDRNSAALNAKVTGVSAEIQATTINGNISITPHMVTEIKDSVSDQFGNKVASQAVDIKVNTVAADGKPLTVIVSTDSLKSNATLKAYIIDPVTGGYVLTEIPSIKYNSKTGLVTGALAGGFEYHYVSAKEAKKIEQAILNSVKVSDEFKNPVSALPGQSVDMTKALSSSVNSANVSKVEYSVAGSKATINPVTGQLTINGNATKGTITVSIKVTLKNGKTKTVKTKIKIS